MYRVSLATGGALPRVSYALHRQGRWLKTDWVQQSLTVPTHQPCACGSEEACKLTDDITKRRRSQVLSQMPGVCGTIFVLPGRSDLTVMANGKSNYMMNHGRWCVMRPIKSHQSQNMHQRSFCLFCAVCCRSCPAVLRLSAVLTVIYKSLKLHFAGFCKSSAKCSFSLNACQHQNVDSSMG